MKQRLPIYGLLAIGYGVIFTGLIRFYKSLLIIEEITIPASVQTRSSIGIVPLLIIGIFGFIILTSIGAYLLSALWKYFIAHKTMLPIPFLLIGIGFIQLAINLMTAVRMMIESNAQMFIDNLGLYISASMSLTYWTIGGMTFILCSVIYSIYLKYK